MVNIYEIKGLNFSPAYIEVNYLDNILRIDSIFSELGFIGKTMNQLRLWLYNKYPHYIIYNHGKCAYIKWNELHKSKPKTQQDESNKSNNHNQNFPSSISPTNLSQTLTGGVINLGF